MWKLKKLDIPIRFNPIKSCKTLVFTKILQPEIREEVKKGIYLNLQTEAIACVQKELTAVRRFSAYLNDSYPEVKSCSEIDREVLEDYLVYLKTEATETKHFHADLNRLRALLDALERYVNIQTWNPYSSQEISHQHQKLSLKPILTENLSGSMRPW